MSRVDHCYTVLPLRVSGRTEYTAGAGCSPTLPPGQLLSLPNVAELAAAAAAKLGHRRQVGHRFVTLLPRVGTQLHLSLGEARGCAQGR